MTNPTSLPGTAELAHAGDFFRPTWLGEISAENRDRPTGVYLFGLVVDPSGYLTAGAFGGRAGPLERFLAELQLGLPQRAVIGERRTDFRPASNGSWECFEAEPPDGSGRLALVLDRTLLMTRPMEAYEERCRFFTPGSAGSGQPYLGLWARRLHEVLSAPVLPEWQPRLWAEMAALAWIAPCRSFGGFGPVWDVSLERPEALALLLALVRQKTLQ